MQQSKQLANRFQEVLLNGKWVANTNLKQQLTDVSYQEATTQIGSLNTIALLTFHINYYIAGLNVFFNNGKLEIRDKYSFDMPPISTDKEWQLLVTSLIANAEKFVNFIEEMTDEKLDTIFIDKKYGTYRRNIDGMIEHAYYHLGQITLIKKLIRA